MQGRRLDVRTLLDLRDIRLMEPRDIGEAAAASNLVISSSLLQLSGIP
jgi:hypothetical protein